VLLAIVSSGLVLLSIAQMCWSLRAHGLGAFSFFGAGFVAVLVSNLADRHPRDGGINSFHCKESAISRASRVFAVVLYAAAAPVVYYTEYIGEWMAVLSVAVWVVHLQARLFDSSAQTSPMCAPLVTGRSAPS
jgi:hypothetical protein